MGGWNATATRASRSRSSRGSVKINKINTPLKISKWTMAQWQKIRDMRKNRKKHGPPKNYVCAQCELCVPNEGARSKKKSISDWLPIIAKSIRTLMQFNWSNIDELPWRRTGRRTRGGRGWFLPLFGTRIRNGILTDTTYLRRVRARRHGGGKIRKDTCFWGMNT